MHNADTFAGLAEQKISSWLQSVFANLDRKNQRQLLTLQGGEGWCKQMRELILVETGCADNLTLSDSISTGTVCRPPQVETLLGSEARVVVVDLFQGINPDVLSIASGLVMSGGLLVTLSPQLNRWQSLEDKYGIWQNAAVSTRPVFAQYFFASLTRYPDACIHLYEGETLPPVATIPSARPVSLDAGKTLEQTDILNRIDNWVDDESRSLALICAHRGRGKSACLGFMVRDIFQARQMKVVVSAYSRLSAATLLHFAGEVEFVAPDLLIASPRSIDVLVIDEAAMLPFPMLQQLCELYPKVVMATTTGGYEGTGQGFLLRFVAGLEQRDILRLSIDAPVRWAEDDCLEACLDEILLLKPPCNDRPLMVNAQGCTYSIVAGDSRDDTELLLSIYQLMVSAHYRTRPSDLRMLMENPDLIFIIAKSGSQLIGVAILNREGGFESDLCEQVFLGKRRPKGHLLAQMITAQAGAESFGGYRGLRIQRIAVAEPCRRKGVGRRLIEEAIELATSDSYDYLGASFAFDAESSSFWNSCGGRVAHIGFGQGKSSGHHSVAVLWSVNPRLEGIVTQLQLRIQRQLPVWMCQFLQFMDAGSVIALLQFCRFTVEQSALEQAEVKAFVYGNKGFELCFASLQPFIMQLIAGSPPGVAIHHLLIVKGVQNRGWDQLKAGQGINGRKQMQRQLRELIADML